METFEEKLNAGIACIEQEDFDRAIELGQELQILNPSAAEGYHLEGLAQQYKYEWEKSIECLSKAIEFAPYDGSLFNQRGFGYMSIDEYEKAEEDYNQAIKLEELEEAHRNKVLLLIVQNRSSEAIDYLKERIAQKPEDAENWDFMGDLMSKVEMTDKAESFYNHASDLRLKNAH